MSSEVSQQEVRNALERVLSSAQFRQSGRLSEFLRFIVERTLAGEADALKEVVIASEALGKGDEHDPRIDPSVRVIAGRVRKRLKTYYDGPGASDPVIIEMPAAGYVPSFRPREQQPLPPPETPDDFPVEPAPTPEPAEQENGAGVLIPAQTDILPEDEPPSLPRPRSRAMRLIGSAGVLGFCVLVFFVAGFGRGDPDIHMPVRPKHPTPPADALTRRTVPPQPRARSGSIAPKAVLPSSVALSGRWAGTIDGVHGPYLITLELDELDGKVIGTVFYPAGSGSVEGTLVGDAFRFQTKHRPSFAKEVAVTLGQGRVGKDVIHLKITGEDGLESGTVRRSPKFK